MTMSSDRWASACREREMEINVSESEKKCILQKQYRED
jgi:hypothetical protein